MHLSVLLISGVLLAALAPLVVVRADDDSNSLNRNQEVDEGSCICGLNKEILNKIETIVAQASSQQSCSISTNQPRDEDGQSQQMVSTSTAATTSTSDNQQHESNSESGGTPPSTAQIGGSTTSTSEGGTSSTSSGTDAQSNSGQSVNQSNDSTGSLVDKLSAEIQALQAQLAGLNPTSGSVNGGLSGGGSFGTALNQVWRPSLQQQGQQSGAGNSQGSQNQNQISSTFVTTNWPAGSSLNQTSAVINNNSNLNSGGGGNNYAQQSSSSRPETSPQLGGSGSFEGSISSSNGFIQGLPQTTLTSTGLVESINGANRPDVPMSQQSNQEGSVQTAQEVQSAMESTVPNVVSNIFSNIQNLAIQTEHNPNANSGSGSQGGSSSDILTSIDGSSIHLHKNDTAAQITEQGEQLFLQWIEHQIQTFHMTASMASYIRKTALGLFRRIVKQYVERIERLGGRVEDNVRKATQVALNNTQNLISFLLRNYLNVAGGLMQIIGEQVSRVGKQLDSTGDTIAHINLNPFDIVSNVIGSLPNPTHYSEYFRAFGKYLMGESSSTQQSNGDGQQVVEQQQVTSGTQQQQASVQQQQPQGERHKGLFSKTMGALGKTLGSWLG